MRVFAIAALVLIAATSLLAPVLAPFDPDRIDMANRLAGFSLQHWLGTDHLGRDEFSRLLFGGRSTVLLAFAATTATLGIGLILGTLSGYFGGWVDDVIQGFVLLFQGLPGLSFMLAIAGTLGPGVHSLFIAVVMTSWADFSRVVRAETLKIREENYVEAMRALGAGPLYIMINHVIPNLFAPLVVLFTVRIGRMVLSIAALSFLGLGLQPPTADWGVMISDSRPFFRSAPHLMLAPGLMILLLSIATNLLGDELRDRMDRRMDKRLLELNP